MFKYFISASERKGSCYFEFSARGCEGDTTEHLQIESIYITVPNWFNTTLEATIASFCYTYKPFGNTTVTKERWAAIFRSAKLAGGELWDVVKEASEWANQVFFTPRHFYYIRTTTLCSTTFGKKR